MTIGRTLTSTLAPRILHLEQLQEQQEEQEGRQLSDSFGQSEQATFVWLQGLLTSLQRERSTAATNAVSLWRPNAGLCLFLRSRSRLNRPGRDVPHRRRLRRSAKDDHSQAAARRRARDAHAWSKQQQQSQRGLKLVIARCGRGPAEGRQEPRAARARLCRSQEEDHGRRWRLRLSQTTAACQPAASVAAGSPAGTAAATADKGSAEATGTALSQRDTRSLSQRFTRRARLSITLHFPCSLQAPK